METCNNVRCVLCGSSDIKKISDSLRGEMRVNYAMRPHRCAGCGLVFLHPYMDEAEETIFYQRLFRETYHGAGYDVGRFHNRGLPEAMRRMDMLDKSGLLRGVVLEIGCATGYFLETVAGFGGLKRCLGVKPDDSQRAFARGRGLEVCRSVEELGHVKADLIVMFHVLEHVRNPVEFIAAASDMLAPNGHVVVEVPNVSDALLTRYAIKEFEEFYWHVAHHFYFSKDTLLAIAEKAGLKAYVEPVQRYSLSNHMHWAAKGLPGGQTWLSDLLSPATEKSYAEDLCRSFECDTLWLVANRPL